MARHFSNEEKASFKPVKFNLRSAVIIVLILVMAFSGYKVLSGVIKYKAGEKFDEDLQTEIVEVVKKTPVSFACYVGCKNFKFFFRQKKICRGSKNG